MKINLHAIFCFIQVISPKWQNSQLKMKPPLIYKIFFLGFIALFMNLGKLCANDVSHNSDCSKNASLTIYSFTKKNVFNATPVIVESDLEYDDSQTVHHTSCTSDNISHSLDLLFGYNNYLSPKTVISHFPLQFPVKRYLLNCIFLI